MASKPRVVRCILLLNTVLIGLACVGEIGPAGPQGPHGEVGSIGKRGGTGRQGFTGSADGVIWMDANDVEVGSIQRFAFYDPEGATTGKRFFLFSQLVYTDEQGIRWPISPVTGQIQTDHPIIDEEKVPFLHHSCQEAGKLYYPVTPGFAFRVSETWYVAPKERTAPNQRPLSRLDSESCKETVNLPPFPLFFVENLEIVMPPPVSFQIPLHPAHR